MKYLVKVFGETFATDTVITRSMLQFLYQEVQFIAAYLNALIKEGVDVNTGCLVARTNDLLKQYESALQERGIKTYLVKRSVAEDRKAAGLRLATMHRVKGLEFDDVIIASVNEGVVPLQHFGFSPKSGFSPNMDFPEVAELDGFTIRFPIPEAYLSP